MDEFSIRMLECIVHRFLSQIATLQTVSVE